MRRGIERGADIVDRRLKGAPRQRGCGDGGVVADPHARRIAFGQLRDQLNAKGMKTAQARTLRRKLVAAAAIVEPDGNGRISIPASLRATAGIERKAVLLGNGDSFELWSEQAYQEQMRQSLGDADLDDDLLDLPL